MLGGVQRMSARRRPDRNGPLEERLADVRAGLADAEAAHRKLLDTAPDELTREFVDAGQRATSLAKAADRLRWNLDAARQEVSHFKDSAKPADGHTFRDPYQRGRAGDGDRERAAQASAHEKRIAGELAEVERQIATVQEHVTRLTAKALTAED